MSKGTCSSNCRTVRNNPDEALLPHQKTWRRPTWNSSFAPCSQSTWSCTGSYSPHPYKLLPGARWNTKKESKHHAEDSGRTTQSSSLNAQHVMRTREADILKGCFRSLHSGQEQNQSRRWSVGAGTTNRWSRTLKKARHRLYVDDVDSQTKPWLTSRKTVPTLRASDHAIVQCSSSLKKPGLTLERGRKSSREKADPAGTAVLETVIHHFVHRLLNDRDKLKSKNCSLIRKLW